MVKNSVLHFVRKTILSHAITMNQNVVTTLRARLPYVIIN